MPAVIDTKQSKTQTKGATKETAGSGTVAVGECQGRRRKPDTRLCERETLAPWEGQRGCKHNACQTASGVGVAMAQ